MPTLVPCRGGGETSTENPRPLPWKSIRRDSQELPAKFKNNRSDNMNRPLPPFRKSPFLKTATMLTSVRKKVLLSEDHPPPTFKKKKKKKNTLKASNFVTKNRIIEQYLPKLWIIPENLWASRLLYEIGTTNRTRWPKISLPGPYFLLLESRTVYIRMNDREGKGRSY